MAEAQDSNAKGDTEANTKIDLDYILVNEIGQFGKFQLKTLILCVIIGALGSWGFTGYLFTAGRIPSRCVIPECDGSQPEWSPYWLSNAVPTTSSGSFDNCQRFGNSSALQRLVESDTCPSTLFYRDILQPCDEYVYENMDTVVYDLYKYRHARLNVIACGSVVSRVIPFPMIWREGRWLVHALYSWTGATCGGWSVLLAMFDLACDEWRRSLIGTIRTFGTLTALPITGYISDRWGRRVALIVNAFNMAWLGVIRYWSKTYIGFMMSEFIESTFGSGGFSSVYILVTELTGPKYRVASGASINSSFALGQMLLGLIAWGIPNWKDLTLALYIPMFLTISYIWLISESVRWYMSKGRFDESEALLKKVAKVNGKSLSDKSLQALRQNAEEEARVSAEEVNKDEPWLIVQVFRHKQILLRCCVSPVWWITTMFIYYGLSINVVHMSGNRYINFIAVAAVELPGYWTAVFLLGIIGRKPVLIGAFWMCAACQIAYIFMPPDLYALSLTVYLIGKYCIAVVMTSIYVYTAELYPTKNRHSLFAFSSMMGRIGSMVAPLTPAAGAQWFEALPFVLFASFALLSGALIFLTPETLGYPLPDTFEQASQIGRKNKKDANS